MGLHRKLYVGRAAVARPRIGSRREWRWVSEVTWKGRESPEQRHTTKCWTLLIKFFLKKSPDWNCIMLTIFPTKIAFYHQKTIKSVTPFSVSFCCHGNCLLIQDQNAVMFITIIYSSRWDLCNGLSDPLTELCHVPTVVFNTFQSISARKGSQSNSLHCSKLIWSSLLGAGSAVWDGGISILVTTNHSPSILPLWIGPLNTAVWCHDTLVYDVCCPFVTNIFTNSWL